MVESFWPQSRWFKACPRYQDTTGAPVASKLQCANALLTSGIHHFLRHKDRLTCCI